MQLSSRYGSRRPSQRGDVAGLMSFDSAAFQGPLESAFALPCLLGTLTPMALADMILLSLLLWSLFPHPPAGGRKSSSDPDRGNQAILLPGSGPHGPHGINLPQGPYGVLLPV
jgi:hypothetical protein